MILAPTKNPAHAVRWWHRNVGRGRQPFSSQAETHSKLSQRNIRPGRLPGLGERVSKLRFLIVKARRCWLLPVNR